MILPAPIFVAMGMGYWGRGATPQEAKDNLRREGGFLTNHVVYLLPPGTSEASVDGMGYLQYRMAEGVEINPANQCIVVSKRGATG